MRRNFQFASFLPLIVLLITGCTNYDVDTPDTPANRAGFKRHLNIKPADSAKNVYYYADEFGGDVRYQLSFQCDKAMIDKIIQSLGLQQAPDDYNGLSPRDDLTWWAPDSTDGRTLWVKQKKKQYYLELWYSESDSRAFYHEYSM